MAVAAVRVLASAAAAVAGEEEEEAKNAWAVVTGAVEVVEAVEVVVGKTKVKAVENQEAEVVA